MTINTIAMESSSLSERQALFVGGCKASYHLLEPAIPHLQAVAAALGMALDISGIYHPRRFAPSETAADTPEIAGDYTALNRENLDRYSLLFLFTTGDSNGEDVDTLVEWIRKGGALVGIHCAADSFVKNEEYIAAIGGKFRTHPAPLDIAIEFVDTDHPITVGLSAFTVHDELYLFDNYDPARVHLLAQTRSYPHYPDQPDSPIPVCWTREEGKGRIFYLSLGHHPEVMADATWQELARRGAIWALERFAAEGQSNNGE